MKANRAPRLRQADEAVSSVVAAVLLFALFTTAFALWTLTTLPQWIADREERHMETVKERFDTLKAGLDAVSGTGSTAPVSAPIPLAAEKVALLQRSPATGRLAFVDGLSATASFTSPELFLVGGQAAGTPTCSVAGGGSGCPATATLSNVRSLTSLVVGLTTAGTAPTGSAVVYVQAVLTDSAGLAVTVEVAQVGPTVAATLGCSNANAALRAGVKIGAGSFTYSLLECNAASPVATLYRYDLMDPGTGVKAALATLAAPYATVAMSVSAAAGGATPTGTYSAIWVDDATGRDMVAGTGLSQAFAVSQTGGGALQYAAANQHFPDQTVSYEFGGVLRSQADGQAMATSPGFQLDVSGTTGTLRWTLVRLTGSGAISGEGQATAVLARQTTNEVLLTATSGTFVLTTPEAQGWANYLKDQLVLAGFTPASCDPGVAAGAVTWNLATCKVGASPGTSLASWTLHLTLVDASVTVA